MGLKLEIIIGIMIIAIVTVTATVKLTNNTSYKQLNYNELKFNNTTFIEVDKTRMQAKVFSSYGVRSKGVLTLTNLKYNTSNIEELLADKGMYKGSVLHLEGNIILRTKDGFGYSTEKAQYNQKTEILNITTPFVSKMHKNVIFGKTLEYNAIKKEVQGTSIDAVVYTVKK